MEQRAHGLDVWREPLVPLRVPKIYNLRSDPFERGDEDASMFYDKWMADRAFLLVPAQAIVGEFLKTFEEFPPRQKPASFSIDQALEKRAQTGEDNDRGGQCTGTEDAAGGGQSASTGRPSAIATRRGGCVRASDERTVPGDVLATSSGAAALGGAPRVQLQVPEGQFQISTWPCHEPRRTRASRG